MRMIITLSKMEVLLAWSEFCGSNEVFSDDLKRVGRHGE